MELEHLKKIFNSFNSGICVLDENLKVYYWNNWLAHHTNVQNSDIVDNYLHHYVEGVSKKVLQRKIKTAITLNSPTFYPESLKNYLFQIPVISSVNESESLMKQSISIIPYGNSNKVIVAIIDKTKEFEYSHSLQKKIQEVATLNNELQSDIKIIDKFICSVRTNSDGKIIKFSNKLLQTLGVTKKSLTDCQFADIFFPLDGYVKKKSIPEYILQSVINDSIYVFENSVEPVYLKVIDHFRDKMKGTVYFFQDISDFIHLQYQQDKLLGQSRSAAMGEMISMIAHQWRQPLTVLSGTMANIRIKDALGKLEQVDIRKSLESMEHIVVHLSQTISDFSNFFKPSKKKETMPLGTLYEKVLILCDNLVKDQNVTIDINGDLNNNLRLFANELIQVLITLIQNSVDAFRENTIENPYIKLDFEEKDEEYLFWIKDNAGGIQEENITHIFDPYFSTKSVNGTGIGLYMVKKLIQDSMKGDLSVLSEGTTTIFTIKIPKV